MPETARFSPKPVFNYQYVLHDLQLNAWVIAWRRQIGDSFIAWYGEQESELVPPRDPRQLRLAEDDAVVIEGLRTTTPPLIRPDALVELAMEGGTGFGSSSSNTTALVGGGQGAAEVRALRRLPVLVVAPQRGVRAPT